MKKKLIVVLAVLSALLLSCAAGSSATILPDSVYLTQEGSNTCTLSSAAMMLRARAYLSGNNGWSGITESGIRGTAWSGGLKWSWTYSFSGNSITVAHENAATMSLPEVKHVLDLCPEGIVLYCGGKPHAVFLIDYSGDTLYCADPLSNYSGERIPLASSYLGAYYGGQDGVLDNITAYWYVDSYNISKDFEPAGTYMTSPLVFNVSWYKAHSEQAIKNMTDAEATNHWVTLGYKEGRNGNAAFNPKYYLENNADVKKAYGNDYAKAIEHFVAYGHNEWRVSSSAFNPKHYRDNYTDLQKAYGNNCKSYVEHYIAFADKENRIANVRMHVKYVDENGNAYSSAPQKLLTMGAAFGNLYAPSKTGYTLTWKDQYGRTITKDSTHDKEVAEIVLKANWTPIKYVLDVNGRLDGQDKGNISGIGTFDLTVGSTKTRDDDYDCYDKIDYGTKYAISDIKSADTAKYKYVKVCEGSASGTITGATNVRLEFHSLYDVKFNKNTTDTVSGMPSNLKKEWGVDLTLPGSVPTRANYTFSGWNTKADGTGASYAASAKYKDNGPITLYAVWTPIKYVLDVNGRLDGQDQGSTSGFGTFDVTIGSTKTRNDDYDCYDQIISGSAYSITDIKPTDAAKYKYVGVCEGSASGTVTGAVKVRLEFHSLYDVTFSAGTEDAVSGMPSAAQKEWGVDLTLSGASPARPGHTFLWWKDQNGAVYYPGNAYKKNEALSLTAVWGKNGAEMSEGAGQVILSGDYEIRPSADGTCFLDIGGSDSPAPENKNVQLWTKAEPLNPFDVWTVTYLGDGFYSIIQKGSDMALTVADGSVAYRGNIQVNKYEGKTSQQWSITAAFQGSDRTGFRLQARCSGLSLDIQGGAMASGANIHQWEANEGGAQSWVFIPSNPPQTIADGRYMLISALSDTLELDVSGDRGDIPNGQNVQVWNDNDDSFRTKAKSQYNSFDVTYLGDGYYKLINACSGKALTVSEESTLFYQNVFVSDYTGAKTQQWAIVQNGDAYVLMPRCSGYSLNVKAAGTENGTNVVQFGHHTHQNEAWRFVPAEYTVSYDLCGGKEALDSQTKYYKGDLLLHETVPTKDGMLFGGWATAKGSEPAYQPGDTFSPDQDTVLYAVWNASGLVLPASLKTVEAEAFAGGRFTTVVVPASVEEIGAKAFADCPNLTHIFFLGNEIQIAKDAFFGVDGLVFHCLEKNDAYWFAVRYEIDVELMD